MIKINKGFTLIETLVSLAILAIISTVVASIIYVVFRSSEKVEILKEIKQNGESAVSVMGDLIRQAQEADCAAFGDSLTIIVKGESTILRCDSSANNRVASNSAFLTSSSVACQEMNFACQATENNDTLVSFSFTLGQGGYSGDFTGKVLLVN
ncbi:MAG: prepilin-type N-terminal cleavage/methylation domain-containing protein [Candidatus Shapirobacteria bacterium]